MKPILSLSLGAATLLMLSCSDDTSRPHGDGGTGDGARRDGEPATKIAWNKIVVDRERAGRHASLSVAGTKIGIAYLRELVAPVTVNCPKSGFEPGGPKDRPAQDIMYVQDPGSGFGTPVKVDQTIGNPYGLSLALDPQGKATIGYLGGAMSAQECASSDAIMATSSDGTAFAKTTLFDAGAVGDTVGYWMAVAVDSKGAAHAAFRDVRFGYYEREGSQKASARYDKEAITNEDGSGEYNSLVFDAADSPIVAFLNPEQMGATGGLLLASKKGGVWSTVQLAGGSTRERPSLARSSLGNLGLAFYQPTEQQLRYLESDRTDLRKLPWQNTLVDADLSHSGEFPSLAYDSKGNPAISYYKCGAYGTDKCDLTKDGLRFAWRRDASGWSIYEVDGGDVQACGRYTSLAFLPGDQPVIAYQCVATNSVTKDPVAGLKIAKGTVK